LAIEGDPNNAIYYANRGLAYQKLNNHEQAITDLEKAISLNPSYIKTYPRLASSYSVLHNYSKALQTIDMGLAIEPNNESLLKQKTEISASTTPPPAGNELPFPPGGFPGMPPGMPGMPPGMPGMPPGMPGMPPGMPGMPPGMPGMPAGMPAGMPNFYELMNNPEFMAMATQLVQNNPEVMNFARQVAENPQRLQQMFSGFPPPHSGNDM